MDTDRLPAAPAPIAVQLGPPGRCAHRAGASPARGRASGRRGPATRL